MMSSDAAFAAIEQIANINGNTKQYYLQGYPDLIPYLQAAYDPFKRYYITKGKLGGGDLEFELGTWEILSRLNTRRLSGNLAQETVNSITAGMTPASAFLFNRILKKDLRFGMGAKTINKVFPNLIPTHDIMRAKLWDQNKIKFPCFGSPKIDGVRAKFKNGKFYSRNGHEYGGLQHLSKQLVDITEELDGELIVPGLTFQQSSGKIRNNGTTYNAEFHIFDIPTIKDRFTVRLVMMRDLHLYGPNILKVPHMPLKNIDSVYKYYDMCRDNGYEGAVIKAYDYEYKDARNYNWIKMKPTETVDLKVIDLFEGKGKYKGQMGGAIVNYKGKPNKVGSGWSDAQRYVFWGSPASIIDKTIEIKFMEETDDGNMRHAVFVKFRKDKD